VKVRVRVAAILLKKADPPLQSPEFEIHLEEGSSVERIIEKLRIPEKLVGSVTVNKRRVPRDHVLSEGDFVAILPAISGG